MPTSEDTTRSDERDGFDLARIGRVLERNAGLVAGLVLAAVAVSGLNALLTPRQWAADALLLVEPRDPRVVEIQGMRSEPVEDETRYLRTQYQVLKSRVLAERVIRDNGLRHEALLGGRPAGPDTDWGVLDAGLVDRYLAGIGVEAVPGTRLIRVTATAAAPTLAARIANAHAEAFVRQGVRQRTALNQAGLDFLRARLTELKARLEASEAALNDYRWRKDLLVTEEAKENVVVERLDELNKELSKAESERLALEAEVRTIDTEGVEALPELRKNTTFRELQVHLAIAESEHARLAAQFKPNYPGVTELRRKAETLRQHLDAETRRFADSTRNAYKAARDREDRLRASFAEQKTEALQQKDAAVEYAILSREVDTNRALYDTVLTRMKEMTVAVEVRASNVSVADRAVPPATPIGSGRMRAVAIAAFLAAVAGIVLAFVRDALDDRMRTTEDVERHGTLPHLGAVPRMLPAAERRARSLGALGPRRAGEGAAIVLARTPDPVLADAYRQVRTSLLVGHPDGPPRTLLVTSGGQGEGKSLTTANLAVTFGQIARSVLVIDADFRRPTVHTLFGVARGPGLSEVLTGRVALDDAIEPVDGHTVFVLPAGSLPPNPTELVGSPEMRTLLVEAASRFEYVFIDSPAAFGVSDTLILSTAVDGVIVVARGGRTRRRALRQLVARLGTARAPLVGVVLNGAEDSGEAIGSYPTIDLVPPRSPLPGRGQRAA